MTDSIIRGTSRADRKRAFSDGNEGIANGVLLADPTDVWKARFYYRTLRQRGCSAMWARHTVVALLETTSKFVSYTEFRPSGELA